MIALGIDPGTRKLGWGVVRLNGVRLTHVAHGVVELPERAALGDRLAQLAGELRLIIGHHEPTVGSVEGLFFHKDAQAAAKLGHARGVVLMCLAERGVPIAEYSPAKVKRTVAGSGQAKKPQVARTVRALLAMEQLPPPDAADALALAITHLRVAPLLEALARRTSRLPSTVHALLSSGRSRPASRRAAGRRLALG